MRGGRPEGGPRPPLKTVALLLAAGLPVFAEAQIRTDGSVGPAQTLIGPNVLIPQSLGRLAGSNLFHSFAEFNVGSGESATFSTSSAGIANVISRVSGGSSSRIQGRLALTAASGTPGFWFLNPAGVFFGAGAVIDVPGAFHVSTADYLRFADGEFHVDPAKASTYSSAAPQAFGFLGAMRGAISIRDGAILETPSRMPLDIVGGDIGISGNAKVATAAAELRLLAVGGRRVDVPVAGPAGDAAGDLQLRAGGQALATSGGTIIAGGGNVDVLSGAEILSVAQPGVDAGEVRIDAGRLTVDHTGATDRPVTTVGSESPVAADGKAGTVVIVAGNEVIVRSGGKIRSNSGGAGRAGSVSIRTGTLTIDGRQGGGGTSTGIESESRGSGPAGEIEISTTGAVAVINQGRISANAESSGDAGSIHIAAGDLAIEANSRVIAKSTKGSGKAGRIEVSAGEIRIGGVSRIDAGNESSRSGSAGVIEVKAKSVSLSDFSRIAADTLSSGDGGAVNIEVGNSLTVSGTSSVTAESSGSGDAGRIRVNGGTILVERNSWISGSAVRTGARGGSVELSTGGEITVRNGLITAFNQSAREGRGIAVSARDLIVAGSANISARNLGSGRGGSIRVDAENVVVDGGTINARTSGAGRGGDIELHATNLTLKNGGYLNANSEARGSAGSISLTVRDRLNIADQGEIAAVALDAGNAGQVTVRAGSVDLRDTEGRGFTGINTSAYADSGGRSGDLELRADSLSISGFARIRTAGYGTGDAGNAFLQCGEVKLLDGGRIDTSAMDHSTGNGGRVRINAEAITIRGRNTLDRSGIFSNAEYRSSGNAGDIEVTARGTLSVADGGQISSTAQEFSLGNAGSLLLTAGDLRIDGGEILNDVKAQARGDGGRMTIRSPGVVLVGGGGKIVSVADSTGRGGSITIDAQTVRVENFGRIGAEGGYRSQGGTGALTVRASGTVSVVDGAAISMRNSGGNATATGDPRSILVVDGRTIEVRNAEITADASGTTPPGEIRLSFGGRFIMESGRISTRAENGNGGPITIRGSGTLLLDRALVSTSVSGAAGNGGDIDIAVGALAMKTGFIQANTVAANARGGDVRIDTRLLVGSGGELYVGDNVPKEFGLNFGLITYAEYKNILSRFLLFAARPEAYGANVIQAAAPTGISGSIEITTPALDVSGSLGVLKAQAIDAGGLGRSPCQIGAGSSLAPAGRGGLPPSAGEALTVGSAPRARVATGLPTKPEILLLAQSARPCVL